MNARLKRWVFEPDGLGRGWQLAWWLPFAASLVISLITNYSRHEPSRSIALALFVVSGVVLFIVRPLVIWHRRRSGWTKIKLDGRWRWLRPGESRAGYQEH